MKKLPILLGAFLLPFLCFPVLYRVHEYYLIANGVFLLLAVAAILPDKALLPLVLLQLLYFYNHYDLKPDPSAVLNFAAAIDLQTKPDETIVVYGMEWNPEIPYYAHRRAVMETTLASLDDVVKRGLALPHGAFIVRCPCKWDGDPSYEAIFSGLDYNGNCEIGRTK
jgi:hypothetical protein